jgi:quercetin dioxygenase-like cupin family protein
MSFVPASDAVVHELHGARFVSYAAPAFGSKELCAWRCELPAASSAPVHRISREEVFLVLSGSVEMTVDGESRTLAAGDAAFAPPGSSLGVANPAEEPAAMWVTTSVGLHASLPDGSQISPPWVN